MRTVQAPQMPSPQPYFSPVRPRSERRTHRSFRSPSTVICVGLRLSLNLIVSNISVSLLSELPHHSKLTQTPLTLKPIIKVVNGKKNIRPFDLCQTQIDLLALCYTQDRWKTIGAKAS